MERSEPLTNGNGKQTEENEEKPPVDPNHVGMEEKGWKSFFFGPFFKVIPATERHKEDAALSPGQLKRKKAKAKDILENRHHDIHEEDYLGALKRIILNRLDQDETYGMTNNELVPLPFDAPQAWEYLIDFISGAYLVAQATVVMFIAILIDNDERGLVLGSSYTSSFLPVVKALVIVYPLVTLIVMTMLTCEILFRKYMYYRLLSLRILVDWENKMIWQGWFFYYFVATWILLNIWCIYGIVKFWDMGTRSGADTIPFTTWIIVNLQTIQLVIYYYRLLTTEMRLVSLNMIFERAPVEAQMLLTYTYVIDEVVLMEECLEFGAHAVSAFGKRVVNLLTCKMAGNDWSDMATSACFELENLKGSADNFEAVEDQIMKLRNEMNEAAAAEEAAHEQERAAAAAAVAAAAPVPHIPFPGPINPSAAALRNPSTLSYPSAASTLPYPGAPSITAPSTTSAYPTHLFSSTAPAGSGGSSFYPSVAAAGAEVAAVAHTASYPTIAGPEAGAGVPASTAVASSQVALLPPTLQLATSAAILRASHTPLDMSKIQTPPAERAKRQRRKSFEGNWAQRLERNFQRWLYTKFYGTIHGLFTAILVHFKTWPFRGDVPYFRMLLVFELLGVLSVALIVVFGILRATSSTKCASIYNSCQQCSDATSMYSESCTIEWNITKINSTS